MLLLVEFIICIIVAGIGYLIIISRRKYSELKKTGIGFLKPIPIFGNIFNVITGREHIAELLKKATDTYPNDKYVALIEFMQPSILINDLELIKKVTVKDFDSFNDTPQRINENDDPVLARLLRILKGQKWRQMRTTITPIFTTEKIKNMFAFMTECSARVVEFYEKKIKEINPNSLSVDIDFKDISSRYTLDVLASCAFSFDINSLIERDNEFFKKATVLGEQNIWFVIKSTAFKVFPVLMKRLGIRLLPEKSIKYFKRLLLETLEFREETREFRPDLVHLFIEAKKGILKQENVEDKSENFSVVNETVNNTTPTTIKWTEDDLIAQAITFIFAGYGTSSHVLSFATYELGIQPEIQKRLQDEIESVLLKSGGKANYSDIMQMKYMDMVVSETMRKWPVASFTNREASKDYDLGPVSEVNPYSHKVKKGEYIWISIYSLHMNPEYWPKPDAFDPERFSDDNKQNIKPFSYLPFGSGPRNCIGARFALLEIKTILFFLLAKFSFEPCAKTSIPIKISGNSLFMDSSDGFWCNMKLRKNSRLNIDL